MFHFSDLKKDLERTFRFLDSKNDLERKMSRPNPFIKNKKFFS